MSESVNTRATFKRPGFTTCLLLVGVIAISGLFVHSWRSASRNELLQPRGDASLRMMTAINAHHEPFSEYLHIERWLDSWWPPVHEMALSGVIRITQPETALQAMIRLQYVSILVFFLGVVLTSCAVGLCVGRKYAILTGCILMSSGICLEYHYSALTEILAFGLLGCALLLFVLYLRKGTLLCLVPCALTLLVANIFRSELIVYAFAFYLMLLVKKRWTHSFVFGSISSAFFVTKTAYALLFVGWQESTSNAAQRNYDFGDTRLVLANMFQGVLRWENQLCVLLAIALSGMAVLWALNMRRLRLRRAESAEVQGVRSRLQEPCLARDLLLTGVLSTVLFFGFLAYAILSHRMNDQPRYYISVLPFLSVAVASLAKIIVSDTEAHSKGTASAFLNGILILSIVSSLANYQSYFSNRPRLKPASQELVEWLLGKNTNSVVYDFLRYQEPRFMLLTQSIGLPNDGSFYSYHGCEYPEFTLEVSEQNPRRLGLSASAYAHQHIYSGDARYVVLASDLYFEKIQEMALMGYHHRHSYLRPYLSSSPSNSAVVLESPFLPRGADVPLVKVFENWQYVVYENQIANLLPNPAIIGGSHWDIQNGNALKLRNLKFRRSRPICRVDFAKGGSCMQADNVPVRAGETREASIWMWAEKPTEIRLRLGSHGPREYEGQSQTFALSREPTKYSVACQFDTHHPSSILAIEPDLDSEATLFCAAPSVRRKISNHVDGADSSVSPDPLSSNPARPVSGGR